MDAYKYEEYEYYNESFPGEAYPFYYDDGRRLFGSVKAMHKTKREPLTGGCELTCLKLNLLHDGGFNVICDETTAFNDWPYCDGDPAKDDLFHMRQCVLTCRQPEGSGECPNVHSRGNDKRGCEAGQAFKKGLPYEFVTKYGDTVIFHSLVTHAPTPLTVDTNYPTLTPTGSPTGIALITTAPSVRFSGWNRNTTVTNNVTLSPTSLSPTREPTEQLIKYIVIPIALVLLVVLAVLLACYARQKRNKKTEMQTETTVEEVLRETERALENQ